MTTPRFAPLQVDIGQYYVRREDVTVTDKQIADPKVPGKVTDQGVRDNISA
jgi:malate synthase